ncbi:MAG: hypothetical protein RJA09_431 [Pseudomonadota bacterium]
MLDYPSLAALAAVVREGSFERGARALHVTPSAVSQRVRLLEERVGCALVVRGQPCVPTEMGRRLCWHLDRVQALEHDLQGVVPALGPLGTSRIKLPVAVNADSLATWFAPAVAAFAADAPVWLDVAVDDETHTADWLRTGAVLAAVTASAQPATGCSSQALGAMRYLAVASPVFVARYLGAGVSAAALTQAPSLVFSPKDTLQARWARRVCGRAVDLPRHTLPSPQAFVVAALAGVGWGMHPEALVRSHLARGALVELVPDTPLDVPLYWQHARWGAGWVEGLTQQVVQAAQVGLRAKAGRKP